LRAGYFARGSHDLVATRVCPILDARLERELAALPERLRSSEAPPRRVDAAVGDGEPSFAPPVPGLRQGPLLLAAGGFDFEFDPRTFFQAHRGLLPSLIAEVVGEATGKTAWDLYAGVGLFAIPMRERYGQVVAVESDRIAARYLRRNAARSRGIDVRNVSVESFVARAPSALPDRVVVDPPRTGLTREVLARLRRLAPALLTYVSCDPATLARDLRSLGEVFAIEAVTFLDLFPQTAHLETVVQLVRRG
jgi:23S rRNA (uracil1939-C5)-methyltransferase